MKSRALVLIVCLFGAKAWAEVPLFEPPTHELPHLNQGVWVQSASVQRKLSIRQGIGGTPALDPDALAESLRVRFEFYKTMAQGAPADCRSAQAPEYALSLEIAGRLDECSRYAQECSKMDGDLSPRVMLTGALCEASRYRYNEADALFELASLPQHAASPDFSEVLYQYASYALYGGRETFAESILDRHPGWTPAEKKLWKGLILRHGRSDLGALKKDEVDTFLETRIPLESAEFADLLRSIRAWIRSHDYDYPAALAALNQDVPGLRNPLHWYDVLHRTLYFGLDQDFAKSRKSYEVYDQYANPWWVLPVENNTYNYTEISSGVCAAVLLQGPERKAFEDFKASLRNGELTMDAALLAAADWVTRFPKNADVLTVQGGLLAIAGRHEEAMSAYWSAHRSCRYYHRANWGLVLEKRFFKYSGLPDYVSNAAQIDTELAGYTIPPEISNFFLNWGSLTAETRKRVEYGARIWLPFIKPLLEHGSQSYIKYAFDLLSDSPGMGKLRDKRIGGSNYPHDNRLWDDVRGVGGTQVVADLFEVFQTVQGDYNLLGHEMAHQFHHFLEDVDEPGADCIVKLYDRAHQTGNFPDGYSARNKEEYFAQGVTYALVPESAPKRFGLNRSWIRQNDTFQMSFIRSIELSGGDWKKLSCPL